MALRSTLLAVILVVLVGLPMNLKPATAADPDPLVDFAPNTTFVLRDVFTNGNTSHGPGGIRAALSTQAFPGLTSQGITVVRFEMLPCGVNAPHTHPRASELLSLLSGGPLQVGFVDTAGIAHINILYPGDVTIFPRGMLHFEINLGKKTASYLSALNSQNPGTLVAADSLFKIPKRALATALNTEITEVQQIENNVPTALDALQMSPKAHCVPGGNITTKF